jgi:hypothetical protein
MTPGSERPIRDCTDLRQSACQRVFTTRHRRNRKRPVDRRTLKTTLCRAVEETPQDAITLEAALGPAVLTLKKLQPRTEV